jgi:hypothetical protein
LILRDGPAPKQPSSERKNRQRESAVWWEAVERIGSPPQAVSWVHVGDRGADIFEFMAAARQHNCEFLLRCAQNRAVKVVDAQQQAQSAHLKSFARGLAELDVRELPIAAQAGQAGRVAKVAIGVGELEIQAPRHGPRGASKLAPIRAWVVRVWEVGAPPQGTEPLEWILVSTLPTPDKATAWQRVEWYKCRWLVEDYHQCLKTGCSFEERQLQSGAGLQRLLGICAPLAVRLLQLRELARLEPEVVASKYLPAELLAVVSMLAGISNAGLTMQQFWRAVAQLGGHQGRRRDGPPGWLTIWRGWQHVQTVLQGVQLAARIQAEKPV